MNKMYFILAVAGWAWLVVVAVFLTIRLTILDRHKRGFDVSSAKAADAGGDAIARPAEGGR